MRRGVRTHTKGMGAGRGGGGRGKRTRRGSGGVGGAWRVCRTARKRRQEPAGGALTETRPTLYPLQEHQGPGLANGGSPKDSPAHEVTGGGGAYTRFDVPRPRIRRSWPSFRGGAGWAPASRVSSARAEGRGCSGGLGPLRCAAP